MRGRRRPKLTAPPATGLSEFQSEYGGYWSYMMAGCVLTVLPAIILVIVLQKYLVKALAFSGFGGR